MFAGGRNPDSIGGDGGPPIEIRALVPESDGSIWVRTPGALSRFQRGTRLQELPDQIPPGAVTALGGRMACGAGADCAGPAREAVCLM